jgi:hypothetical protein
MAEERQSWAIINLKGSSLETSEHLLLSWLMIQRKTLIKHAIMLNKSMKL